MMSTGRQRTLLAEKLFERRRRSEAEGLTIEEGEEPDVDQVSIADIALDEPPKPTAPKTRKDELYRSQENIALFRDLESHVISVNSAYPTFSVLMDALLVAALSDIEKARILFHWITLQDLNAVDFSTDAMEDTPLGYLKAVKENEKSYAVFFLRLCSAAGLHAKVIEGYLKGVGYCPDHKFTGENDSFRGSWNAVLIKGQWRLIDTHWGARHVTEEENEGQESWRTEYEYEEHYFLTDPDALINTHFPDDSEWQLLPEPVDVAQFERFIKQWPLFYKLKLEQASHHTGMIDTNDKGHAQIKLKLSPLAITDAKFNVELQPRVTQPQSTDVKDLQKCVFHYTTDDEEVFDVFVPHAERFLLKVFCLSRQFSVDDHFTNLCLYQINCSRVRKFKGAFQPPFPIVDASYGINANSREIGVRAISHSTSIVECDEQGESTVIMAISCNSDNVLFSLDLKDSDSAAHDGHVAHTTLPSTSESRLIFYVRAPYNGNFALSLYSNVKSPDGETLTSFCHYLVSSHKLPKEAKTASFPPLDNGKLGPLQPGYNKLGLSLHSYAPSSTEGSHWLKSPSPNGEYSYTFQHSQILVWTASLSSSSTTYDDYVMVRSDGRFSTVSVRCPPMAEEKVVLLLKIYAAPLGQTQDVPGVFTSFISVKKQKHPLFPWPQAPSHVWGPVWEKFQRLSVILVHFPKSLHADSSSESEEKATSPYRKYGGTGDFHIEVDHTFPLEIKPKLLGITAQGEAKTDRENYAIVCKTSTTSSSIRLRFPESGMYSLVLFGEPVETNSGQLSAFYFSLINVKKPCVNKHRFPPTFALWTTSRVELHSPLTSTIKKNEKTTFKLTLGTYIQNVSGEYEVQPYHKVLLLVNEKTPVEPCSESSCDYEWKYTPGQHDKKVGIVVQAVEAEESMSYILLFDVV